MSTAQQKYKELKDKIAETRKVMQETAKSFFTEMSAEIFKENPNLISFRWTQYTPYWNDGEPCEFRCNGDYPTVSLMVEDRLLTYDANSGEMEINGEEFVPAEDMIKRFKQGESVKGYSYDPETDTLFDRNGVKVLTYKEYTDIFEDIENKIGGFLGGFDDEDLESIFGDHVRVTVYRDGRTEVEEYHHD